MRFWNRSSPARAPARPRQVSRESEKSPLAQPVTSVPHFIQPKLRVGAVNDPFEREADRMAETVLRMPSSVSAGSAGSPSGIIQRKPGCACGGSCAKCSGDAENTNLLRKASGSGNTPRSVPGMVNTVVGSSGQPLDSATRSFMEPRFGQDFSQVRVHTDSQAATAAQSVQARAFTLGSNVVFNRGEYAPNSPSGKKLLAHELTHVVQQSQPGIESLARSPVLQRAPGDKPSFGIPELTLDPALGSPFDPVPPISDFKLPRPSILGPAEGAATLEGFAVDSASLTGGHQVQLAALAGRLRRLLSETPGGRVVVVGHTDLVGSEVHNDALGQQRADAVHDELVKLGLGAGGIDTHSLGESVPAVETQKAEARNRRVEVYFSPNAGPNFRGIFIDRLTRPAPLGTGSTPPPKFDPFPKFDYCKVFPEYCDPNRLKPDFFKPVPELKKETGPSISDRVWKPIDRLLERGLEGLGIKGKWNKRIRDAARAGVNKGAREALDKTLDAAGLTGETRDAVDAVIRSGVQMGTP